jgi:glycosyltransferase involved in cell wall biosynthesis
VKLCLIADGRSPIAQNWIRHLLRAGHEVHLVSSYPCDPTALPVASLQIAPIAFSWFGAQIVRSGDQNAMTKSDSQPLAVMAKKACMPLFARARHWLGPLDVYRYVGRIRQLLARLQPELVHAMRIPFEGMLAAKALQGRRTPLLVSVWGNDFTLHAQGSPLVGYLTKRTLARADGLHPDCYRDLILARQWGFAEGKPAVVLPSGGGIQTDLFFPGLTDRQWAERLGIPAGTPVVLNPRGIRGYVRNDTFFQAIPLVLRSKPNVIFLGLAMQGARVAEEWVERLSIAHAVRLLPSVSRAEMAALFRFTDVTVSPSEHDGTPNTLLESMACGAFPVAGNIESVGEWLADGVNGLLCDQRSPESLAAAILRALDDPALCQRAAAHNQRLIAERAEHHAVMLRAERFYQELCNGPVYSRENAVH